MEKNLVLYRRKKDAMDPKNLEDSMQIVLKTVRMFFHPETEKEKKAFRILAVGSLQEGIAKNHETQEEYHCVGFLVLVEHLYEKFMEAPECGIGFFSIWSGAKNSYDPILFYDREDSMDAPAFRNGCGDSIAIIRTIFEPEKVQAVFKAMPEELKGN